VAGVDDEETRRRVEAERRCVAVVGAGCLAPVAAHHDGSALEGLVAHEEGRWVERRRGEDADALGLELAAAAASHASV
jgi:porphobilinogen deaminase